MNYNNIDNRLDLDILIQNACENYPKNDDDFIFYIRGKISTNELFVGSCSNIDNMVNALLNMYYQSDEIKTIIDYLIINIKKNESNY